MDRCDKIDRLWNRKRGSSRIEMQDEEKDEDDKDEISNAEIRSACHTDR